MLEQRDRDYVEHRVRAGVLEHPTVELLRSLGLAERLDREGLAHRGIELAFEGRRHRIDFLELTGRSITVYGQQEVVKDLIAARLAAGGEIVFEALDVEPARRHHRPPGRPLPTTATSSVELRCRIVAGCDGFHGVCRTWCPGCTVAERTYPFAWLGILAEAAPTSGRADLRQPRAWLRPVQHALADDHPPVPPGARRRGARRNGPTTASGTSWHAGCRHDGFTLNTGPVLEKGITAMRSFVATPMRHGNLLLAGDAAHIVPPTGAKGMNLAIADVYVMAGVLDDALRGGGPIGSTTYTATCLQRVWRAQHFSSWMTSMLHRFGDDPFQHQLQLSELALVTGSPTAATSLAENYVGLPFGDLYGGAR